MRNAWKGLIVGSSVGVATGMLLDGLANGSWRKTSASHSGKEQSPVVANWASTVAGKAADRLSSTTVPEKVRQAARSTVQMATTSDSADQARATAAQMAARVRDVVASNGK